MLYTVTVDLFILWALGFVTSYAVSFMPCW